MQTSKSATEIGTAPLDPTQYAFDTWQGMFAPMTFWANLGHHSFATA
ncbi:MAG: hypothetical protein RLZ98_2480, partial [Pseudomonadota bacterium]